MKEAGYDFCFPRLGRWLAAFILLALPAWLSSSCDSPPAVSKTSIEMVPLPAGRFIRGSPLNESLRLSDEVEQWVVIDRPFAIGATEITQEQWQKLMGGNPSRFKDGGPSCPVENITWFEAAEFCNRLSAVDGLPPCYRLKKTGVLWAVHCHGYRLPTEAEWEYAARAGTTTPFAAGSCLEAARANYHGGYPLPSCPAGENREKTMPVKSFAPNPIGLYEMNGNVAEWIWDWYAPYPEEITHDPTGPRQTTLRRGVRGGSWFDPATFCRSACRGKAVPDARSPLVGLRVARTLP